MNRHPRVLDGTGKATEESQDEYMKMIDEEIAKTITSSPTGGLRYNKEKIPLSWVPQELIFGVATVLMKSAVRFGGKYPDHNWQKGLSWVETADSALRHLYKWLAGEDIDSESGLPHLDHIATNIAFLQRFKKTHPELDDRQK